MLRDLDDWLGPLLDDDGGPLHVETGPYELDALLDARRWPLTGDAFDPSLLPAESDDDPLWLSLSDRIDCGCWLDRIDYEWARSLGSGLWCHTYGSGDMDPETGVMARPNGIYARKSVGGRTLFLHREICRRAYGPPDLTYCIGDHKNGNTLDNRRVNLQWATRSMNAMNIAGSDLRKRFEREQGLI